VNKANFIVFGVGNFRFLKASNAVFMKPFINGLTLKQYATLPKKKRANKY
jgi:hypothetical protein